MHVSETPSPPSRGTAAGLPVPPERYTATARALHWTTAGLMLVVGGFGLGIAFAAPEDEAFKLRLYNIHESLGFTVLLLTVVRLAWRAGHPPPPLPEDLPGPLKLAARSNHAALYVMLFVQPIVGFLNTNAWGFPFLYFGLVPIPSPIGRHETLAPILSDIHLVGAIAIAGLVAVHAGAALWHHYGLRDGTLRKMA